MGVAYHLNLLYVIFIWVHDWIIVNLLKLFTQYLGVFLYEMTATPCGSCSSPHSGPSRTEISPHTEYSPQDLQGFNRWLSSGTARRSQKAPQVQFGDCGLQRQSAGSRQVKWRTGKGRVGGGRATGGRGRATDGERRGRVFWNFKYPLFIFNK